MGQAADGRPAPDRMWKHRMGCAPKARKEGLMNETIEKRLSNLLSVKSLVTLVLTAVFAYTALAGHISQDFMTIYAVIIAFYFGTQSQKARDTIDGGND